MKLIEGQKYDVANLEFVCWNYGTNEGYNMHDYFDEDGVYLGPDDDGVEPLVRYVGGTGVMLRKELEHAIDNMLLWQRGVGAFRLRAAGTWTKEKARAFEWGMKHQAEAEAQVMWKCMAYLEYLNNEGLTPGDKPEDTEKPIF